MNVEKVFKWNKRLMLLCIIVIPASLILFFANFQFGGNPPPNPYGGIKLAVSFIAFVLSLLLFFGIMMFESVARFMMFHKQAKSFFDKK
jgi:hypothetical protein